MSALVSELGRGDTFAKYSPQPLQAGTDEIRSPNNRNQAAGSVHPFGMFHQIWNVMQHIGAQETKRESTLFPCYLRLIYSNPAPLKVPVVLQIV